MNLATKHKTKYRKYGRITRSFFIHLKPQSKSYTKNIFGINHETNAYECTRMTRITDVTGGRVDGQSYRTDVKSSIGIIGGKGWGECGRGNDNTS